MQVHPKLPGTADRPDFLVDHGDGRFVVEAATTFSGIEDDLAEHPLVAEVMDAVERFQSKDFTISLTFRKVGSQMPRVREIASPIQSWLGQLDPDAALGADRCPSLRFEIRDWELEIDAFPVLPEHRGPTDQIIAVGPVSVGSVNDVERLRATLDRKRGKYGDLDYPLLVAVLLPSTFADLTTVEKALFGDTAIRYRMGERGHEKWVRVPNGFWFGKDGPRAQAVSGLITGFGLLPGGQFADRRPRLWPNPWASHPFSMTLPMPRSTATQEPVFAHEEDSSAPSLRSVLGLSEEWPGPEGPFG